MPTCLHSLICLNQIQRYILYTANQLKNTEIWIFAHIAQPYCTVTVSQNQFWLLNKAVLSSDTFVCVADKRSALRLSCTAWTGFVSLSFRLPFNVSHMQQKWQRLWVKQRSVHKIQSGALPMAPDDIWSKTISLWTNRNEPIACDVSHL